MCEFVPDDNIRRIRDRLRRLRQSSFVSNYLSAARNMILNISDMTDGEKFERFANGLEGYVRLEVMK